MRTLRAILPLVIAAGQQRVATGARRLVKAIALELRSPYVTKQLDALPSTSSR